MIHDSRVLTINTLLFEKYKIIKTLGEGSFSFVYLAQDKCDVKKHYVIKEFYLHSFVKREKNNKISIKTSLTPDEIKQYNDLKTVFKHEAKNIQKANTTPHPGIVNCINYYENVNNTSYIVSNFIPTIPLQTQLKKVNSPKYLIKLLKEILLTLEHIHYYNIFHQDIKIENILIKQDKTPLIIDFGASVILYDKPSGKYLNTSSPDSAAIEQLSLNYPPEINESTDVFSVGVLMYKILTGAYPISVKQREQAVQIAEKDPYVPLVSMNFSCLSKNTLKAIDKALSLYQEDRYPNTKAFRLALEDQGVWQKLTSFLNKNKQ